MTLVAYDLYIPTSLSPVHIEQDFLWVPQMVLDALQKREISYPCRKSIYEYWMVRLLGQSLYRKRFPSCPVPVYLELIITGIMLHWTGKHNIYAIKNTIQSTSKRGQVIRTSQKPCKHGIANTPDWHRSEAVVYFCLFSGYDCLANHLYHIELFPHSDRTLL